MSTEPVAGANRKRSPSYPAINLEQAIDRAREIWTSEHQYATPVSTIFKHWGYTSSKGNANLVIAALRKFGLLEYEGSGNARRAKLTDLAVRILDHPDNEIRREAIRLAALTPPIHAELWEKYQDKLPSDDHLRWSLEQDSDFSRSGALEFIPEYRATIAFAGLHAGDKLVSQDHSDVGEDDDETGQDLPPERNIRQRSRMTSASVDVLTIPTFDGPPVFIEGVYGISERSWDQFIAVLNAMKPTLLKREETQPE